MWKSSMTPIQRLTEKTLCYTCTYAYSLTNRGNALPCTPTHRLIVKTLYHVRHQFTAWSWKRFAMYDTNHKPIVKRFTVHYINSQPDRENVKRFTTYDTTQTETNRENVLPCTTLIRSLIVKTLYSVRHQFTAWSWKRFTEYNTNQRPIVKRFTMYDTNS